MRYVIWEDGEGRRWRRGIPDEAPDTEAEYGIEAGPPDLTELAEELDWPPEFARRLHNQLCDRQIWDARTLRRAGGMQALTSAVIAAARADAQKVRALLS